MRRTIFYIVIVSTLIFLCCGEKLTPDQKAVNDVLTDYTNALKKGDFPTAYGYIAQVSKNHISVAEFANIWTKELKDGKIGNFSIQNISIIAIQSKIYATAIIRREWISYETNEKGVAGIDYHLCKDVDTWRILRTLELNEKIMAFWNKGEKKKAEELAELCMKIDPFKATSVEQYIAQLYETGSQPVTTSIGVVSKSSISSKDIPLTIKNKGYDGDRFFIEYSVTNNSQLPIKRLIAKAVWQKPDATEILDERTDYLVSYGDTPLEKGYSKTGELTYWPSKEISKVHVDLYVSIDDAGWELIQKDILISIPSIAEDIKFEIIKTSYDRTLASDLISHIYVGRIDYKVTNTSSESIDKLMVKVVWYKSGTSEVFDETERYLIYSGDVPLKPGGSKSDYITSGTGLRGGYPDLTADIYVSKYYDKYELIRKGVNIR